MNPILKSTLLAFGFLSLVMPALALAADPSVVETPALPDEDLLSALKRIHPCLQDSKTGIPNDVFFMNPERANARGQMVLTHRMVRLPISFSSADQCKGPGPTLPIDPHLSEAFPTMIPGIPEVPKREVSHEEKNVPREEMTVSPFFSLTKLSGNVFTNASQPTLLSNILPGIEVEYLRQFSTSWDLKLSYRYTQTGYQALDGLDFTEASTNQSELATSFVFLASEKTRLSLSVGAAQIDELSISDGGQLVVAHVWRPTLGFAASEELAHFFGCELTGRLGAVLFVPIGAAQSFGLSEIAGLGVERHFFHHLILGVGATTSTERQATQNETHSIWSISFAATVGYRF